MKTRKEDWKDRISTHGAGIAAVLLGCIFQGLAGAPTHYPLISLAALGFALGLYRLIPGWSRRMQVMLLWSGAVLLLATALLGVEVEAVRRWIGIGPVAIQSSLLLLPALLIAFAARIDAVGSSAMIVTALALALQPDRAMSMVMAAVLIVLAIRDRRPIVILTALTVSAATALCWMQADTLAPVPFVEGVLADALEFHLLLGLTMGAALFALPLAGGRGNTGWVFGLCWASIILASLFGAYPSPLIGYGVSAIIGYWLSLSLLKNPKDGASAL